MPNSKVFSFLTALNNFSGGFLKNQVDPTIRLPSLGADPNSFTLGGMSGGSFAAD